MLGNGTEPIKFPRGTETILLVDDEDFVRDFGERILGRYGYNVLLATNGKEALEIYRKEKDNISLVILDLVMPEMGGKQCMKELLEINPEAKSSRGQRLRIRRRSAGRSSSWGRGIRTQAL